MRRKLISDVHISKEIVAEKGKHFKIAMKFAINDVCEGINEKLHNEIDRCRCEAIRGRLTRIRGGEYRFRVKVEICKDKSVLETEGFLI